MRIDSRENQRRSLALELLVRSAERWPRTEPRPVFTGHGDSDYLCGACRAVLCAGLAPGQLQGLVLRCPACGATNRVPLLPGAGC